MKFKTDLQAAILTERFFVLSLLSLAVFSFSSASGEDQQSATAKIVVAANTFIQTLNDQQKTTVLLSSTTISNAPAGLTSRQDLSREAD